MDNYKKEIMDSMLAKLQLAGLTVQDLVDHTTPKKESKKGKK